MKENSGENLQKEDISRHRPAILYILPRFDLDTDTHFYHIYELLSLLADRYEIHLVVERGDKPQKGRFASIYTLPSHGMLLKWRRAWATFCIVLQARLAGCRLLYSHYSYYGGVLASSVFRLTGGQSLYWNCGLVGQFRVPWRLNPVTLFKKAYHDLPFWLTLRINSALVTGTSSMGKYYSKQCGIAPTRIEVVPNWVDLQRFDPKCMDQAQARRQLDIPAQGPVLLFVHRIVSRKGSDRLVPIMENVLQFYPDALLLVVGSGPDEIALREQIAFASVSLQDHIRLIGSVSNHRLAPWLAAADVFVMPSREEGFPHVLLEAMAMELPFVAMDVGGVRDITSMFQQQFVVSKFMPQSFAERIITILKNPDIAAQLQTDGWSQVQAYSLEKAVDNFTGLWDKFLQ